MDLPKCLEVMVTHPAHPAALNPAPSFPQREPKARIEHCALLHLLVLLAAPSPQLSRQSNWQCILFAVQPLRSAKASGS